LGSGRVVSKGGWEEKCIAGNKEREKKQNSKHPLSLLAITKNKKPKSEQAKGKKNHLCHGENDDCTKYRIIYHGPMLGNPTVMETQSKKNYRGEKYISIEKPTRPNLRCDDIRIILKYGRNQA
jgi:hypothetical protein